MSSETKTTEPDNSSQLDKVIQSLELIIDLQDDRSHKDENLLGVVNERMNKIEQMIGRFISEHNTFRLGAPHDSDESHEEEQRTDWQAQKAKILAEYGIENDKDEGSDPSSTPSTKEPPVCENSSGWEEGDFDSEDDDEYEYADELQLSEEHEREIEKLKVDLREKIGKAEVELSIKQAKLEQQEARIEEKQAQLERREEELAKARNMNSNENGPGVLGRLKRHLNLVAMIRGDRKPSLSQEVEADKLDAKISMIAAKPKKRKTKSTPPTVADKTVESAEGLDNQEVESVDVVNEPENKADSNEETIEETILESVNEVKADTENAVGNEIVEQPATEPKPTRNPRRKAARRRKKRRSGK